MMQAEKVLFRPENDEVVSGEGSEKMSPKFSPAYLNIKKENNVGVKIYDFSFYILSEYNAHIEREKTRPRCLRSYLEINFGLRQIIPVY